MINKLILFVFILCIVSLTASCNKGQDIPEQRQLSGELKVENAWLRAAAEKSNSAGYLRIWNGTAQGDTLLSIQAEGVGKAEIHESYTTDDGLAGMRPVGKPAVASGDSLILQPGGIHLMLMNLSRSLQQGDSLQLTLQFAKAGSLSVTAAVKN